MGRWVLRGPTAAYLGWAGRRSAYAQSAKSLRWTTTIRSIIFHTHPVRSAPICGEECGKPAARLEKRLRDQFPSWNPSNPSRSATRSFQAGSRFPGSGEVAQFGAIFYPHGIAENGPRGKCSCNPDVGGQTGPSRARTGNSTSSSGNSPSRSDRREPVSAARSPG